MSFDFHCPRGKKNEAVNQNTVCIGTVVLSEKGDVAISLHPGSILLNHSKISFLDISSFQLAYYGKKEERWVVG